MSSTIRSAMKGDRTAFLRLYEANKRTVFYSSQALLRSQASILVTERALKGAFKALMDGEIGSEEAFTAYAVKLTISNCKQELLKSDPKAFRTPPRKDFHLQHINESAIDPELDPLDNYLNCLPPLHRFLVVLNLALEIPANRIGITVGMEPAVMEQALEAEMDNLGKIYRCVKAAGGKCTAPTAELIKSAFRQDIAKEQVPREIDEAIEEYIIDLAGPVKQKTQSRQNRMAFAGGILLVCALALATVLSSSGSVASETTVDMTAGTEASSAAEETQAVSEATEYTEPFHVTEGSEAEETTAETDASEAVSYSAKIDIEGYGSITVLLDQESAPATVENFISLAESGFYDGLTFHRIIQGFMMQGGDPNGDGTGGSGETIVGEFSDNGYDNSLSHTRGAISMARSNDYNSASSQFFIVQEDSTYLDGQYAVFGYVTEGMDVVDEICDAAEPTDTNGSIAPEDQPVIRSITILTSE